QVVVDRLGIKRRREQRGCHRADHAGRNLVVWERRPHCGGDASGAVLARGALARVIQLNRRRLIEQRREVSSHLGWRIYGDEARSWRVIEALSLIVDEEEQLVLEDRSAQRAAEHIPAQGVARQWGGVRVDLVFPLISIQLVVAEEFPDIAV